MASAKLSLLNTMRCATEEEGQVVEAGAAKNAGQGELLYFTKQLLLGEVAG